MHYRHLLSRRDAATAHLGPDGLLAGAVGVLLLFGLLALASASSVYSYERYGSTYHVVGRQLLFGALPGLVLFGLFFILHYQWLRRYRWWFMVATMGLLGAVFVPGVGQVRHGATSWLGVGPFTFQPAELVKLTAVVWLAAWLEQVGYYRVRLWWDGFLPFAFFTGTVVTLIALQPDLGTLLVVGVILVTMYFVAGARWVHLGVIACGAAAALLAVLGQGGYRVQRILVFLNPALDPTDTGYHISQALVAIGSGGWFGRGFGKSHQKFSYLPEVSADSIFAVIAEEVGFLAAAGLVALLVLVVLRGLAVARAAPDPFGRFLATGIAAWFGFQGFLNLAGMIGLAPLTGLPLPFISAGGTALATNLAAVGLLLNISKQRGV